LAITTTVLQGRITFSNNKQGHTTTREEAKPGGDNAAARRHHINIHDHHRHQPEEPSNCNSLSRGADESNFHPIIQWTTGIISK